MANTLRFKRGIVSTIPTAALGEPLFTTDTFDLYIGNGTGNTRFQKYIASGTTSQLLRGDGSLLTMPIVLTSPSNGQVLKFNGTNWVNDSDAGVTGSGANGRVAYWDSASTINGTSNFFWDNSTNRLGINISNPSQTLHVISGGITTANFTHTGTDGGIDVRNNVTLANTRSSQIRLVNGTTFFGANDRSYQLVNIGRSATSADFHIQYFDGTSYLDRFRIFSTGNVGINTGTTDNGLRFQVTGDGFFSGSVGIGSTSLTTSNLRIAKNIGGGPVAYGIYNEGSIQNAVTSAALIYYSRPNIASGTTLSNLYHYAYDQGTISGTLTNQYGYYAGPITGATNNFGFYGDIASGTGRWNLYMNGTAANYLNGNLGLGTLPSAWGTTNSVRALQLTSGSIWNFATTGLYIGQNYFFNGTNRVYVNTNFATEYAQITGSHIWYTAPSGTAGNAITFTQAMTLDASGRLGIGTATTSTSFRLTLNGDSSVNTGGIAIRQSGTDVMYISNISAANTTDFEFWNPRNGYLRFGTNNADRMYIFADGNVGIGTGNTNAGFKLDVNGTMRVSGASTFGGNTTLTGAGLMNHQIISTSTAGYSYTIYKNTGASGREFTVGIGGSTTGNDSNKFFIFDTTAAQPRIIIDSTGNVGFGTYTPAQKLDVVGSTNSIQARFGNVAGRGLTIGTSVIAGTNDAGVVFNAPTATDGTLVFQTSSVDRLTISGTGAATFSSTAQAAGFISSGGTGYAVINSAANTVTAIRPTGGGTNIMSTNSNGLHIAVGTQATGDLILATNNTERIRLSSDGFFSQGNGTNPTASIADRYIQYSADIVAGNAAPHFRTENGAVIKLYQQDNSIAAANFVAGIGTSVTTLDAFDGYTIGQVVRALRNAGILS